jgi:hypothetical protein
MRGYRRGGGCLPDAQKLHLLPVALTGQGQGIGCAKWAVSEDVWARKYAGHRDLMLEKVSF